MLKNKRILLIIMAVAILFLIPSICHATDTIPTVKTELYGTNKSIKVTITNITLDEDNDYAWGISKAKATQPEEWLDLYSIESDKIVAIISPEKEKSRKILRSVDSCYIFIKDKTNDETVITEKVNLKLSLKNALDIQCKDKMVVITYVYAGNATIKDTGSYYTKVQKIDDKNIIKKYLNAKNANQNTMEAVKDLLPTQVPDSGWEKMSAYSTFNDASLGISNQTKYEGLYIIWGQVSFAEGRSIYGYTLYDNYPNGYVLADDDEKNEGKEPSDKDEEKQDTTQYVSFPFIIMNGKSSISIKNYKGDYTLYYQFVDVNDEQFENIEKLKDKYKKSEITYEDFLKQYKTILPIYNEENWIKTVDGKFEKDLSEFMGTKRFALWAKVEMSGKTVYEAEVYTMNGNGQSSNIPDEIDKEETKESSDNTTKKDTQLPQTGATLLSLVAMSLIVVAVIAKIKSNQYKDI